MRTTDPVLPGLPAGYRWSVYKSWTGWHVVELRKWNGKKWKFVDLDAATVSCWTESLKPNAEQLPTMIRQAAKRILARRKEKETLKSVSEQWVGVYESRKV